MKQIIVRIAVVAFVAGGILPTLSAAPAKDPHQPQPGSPIPICYQCGHGDGN